MAFLFKSKKGPPAGTGLPPASRKLTSRDGPNIAGPSAFTNPQNIDEKLRPFANQGQPLDSAVTAPQQNRTDMVGKPPRTGKGSRRPGTDPALFPWSRHAMQFGTESIPFPRYGAAVNGVASNDGDIYMCGGLIEGMDVKGDLWIVEAASSPLRCYMIPTNPEGPSPRVGHASLLVGNAYVVFGGDTKVEETDILDDTLYLLNTATKQWSRALPAGARPAGRYGHSLNIIGSKIYIFGGQVEGFFFNDLHAFDLNALQGSSSRWELLIQNTGDGRVARGQTPSPRTNHTVITYEDKLYLFGGTDGTNWFNDVWVYEPRTNSWTIQECIGFIPSPREGHAAAVVGDVMYVFGGRSETGHDLGDVAGFKITTRRWYTFQNMGPSPSPRSGHGMCAFGSQIFIFGGEPSTAPRDPVELSEAYVLDTAKIRYPDERPAPKAVGARRPSFGERASTPQDAERSASRDDVANGSGLKTRGSQESMNSSSGTFLSNGAGLKSTRTATPPAPAGPPPPQSQTNGARPVYPVASEGGRESPAATQTQEKPIPSTSRDLQSLTTRDTSAKDAVAGTGVSPKGYQTSRTAGQTDPYNLNQGRYDYGSQTRQEAGTPPISHSYQQNHQQQSSSESTQRAITGTPDQAGMSLGEEALQSHFKQPQYADSGVGSSPSLSQQYGGQQHDSLIKELESVKNKNAWYASELALARKAGYQSSAMENLTDERTLEAFGDDEKPMLEALLRTRSELTLVQESLATQSTAAATRIAQVEKEKEAAIAEAMYARTKLLSRDDSRELGSNETGRADLADRRLAAALAAQTDLNNHIQALTRDLELERKSRELAEQSAEAAHGRADALDNDKQQSTAEIERLRNELYESELSAREHSSKHAEAQSSLELLQVDKRDLSDQLTAAQDSSRNHQSILTALREAVTTSSDKAQLLEKKLEQEKQQKTVTEEKLAKLRVEHESRVVELDSTQARLRDAEELAASHAAEARTHKEAVLAGLDTQSRDLPDMTSSSDERVTILQSRIEEANALVQSNQEAANVASEKLRRAEERIAGLEAYQEQMSREGLGLRKQLHAASKDHLALRSEYTELQQQFSTHKLESTALAVQHSSLKNLISDRGIDTESLERGLSTADTTTNADRLTELEQQLEASGKAHEQLRQSFEQREQEANQGWEAKLTALDNDYQSAVKYLKGTEKMLTKLKQELHRYKTANKELEDELARQRSDSTSRDIAAMGAASSSGQAVRESERDALRAEISAVEARLQESTSRLESQMAELQAATAERDNYKDTSARYAEELATVQQSSEKSRTDLASLKRQNALLEERASEAERKVQVLLDTVGNTVDNYRRMSQAQGQPNSVLSNGPSSAQAGLATSDPAATAGLSKTHSRGLSATSIGADSASSFSISGLGEHTGNDGSASPYAAFSRNSVALDSLASELETLRSHWENTSMNNTYRSNDNVPAGEDDSDVEDQVAGTSARGLAT